MAERSNTAEFIQKATALYGYEFDYSKVDYIKSSEKVEITCRKHGSFWMTPNNHLRGWKCRACKYEALGELRRHKLDDVIAKFKAVHSDRYDYSKVTRYQNNKHKVEIVCHKHGSFFQTSDGHLAGHGCPFCAWEVTATALHGIEPDAHSFLYILDFAYEDEYFYKIGITNDPLQRKYNLKSYTIYEIGVVALFEGTRRACFDVEQGLLKQLKRKYNYKPRHPFAGQYECIACNPLDMPGVQDFILSSGLVTPGGNSLELSYRTKPRRKRDALHCTGCDV